MGKCCSSERQHQVQWTASCVGATRARISLCYMLSEVTTCFRDTVTEQTLSFLGHRVNLSFLYRCHTGTTHIFKSAQGSGSPPTNSTFTTPNCCSCALRPSSRSALTQEAGAARATSTSSPTSSTQCSTYSTRTGICLFACFIIDMC